MSLDPIQKTTITKTMKLEALQAAIQHKFKQRVDTLEKVLKDAVTAYTLANPDNVVSQAMYDNADDDCRKLIRQTTDIYLNKILPTIKDGKETMKEESVGTRLVVDLDFLSPNDPYADIRFPFSREKRYYVNTVSLTFSKCLLASSFTFTEDGEPDWLKSFIRNRDLLEKEIYIFAKDLHHAMFNLKKLHEFRTHLPAMEQFINIPDKEFTKLVPTDFFDKVNKAI